MAGGMYCHYCEQEVREVWDYQRDHFPRPQSKGGQETVIACNKCHHLKDRSNFLDLWKLVDDLAASQIGQPIATYWHALNDFCGAIRCDDTSDAVSIAKEHWEQWPAEIRIVAGAMLRGAKW